MSVAIASVVTSQFSIASLGRENLGRMGRFGTAGLMLGVAGGLLAATMTSGAVACTGTTLVASAVELPALTLSA